MPFGQAKKCLRFWALGKVGGQKIVFLGVEKVVSLKMPSLVTHEREKEKQMEKSNFFMWKGSGTAGAERWRSVTGGPFLALIRCADGQIFLGLVYRAGLGSLGRWSAGRVEVLMELMA
ncbi:hypothetical protein GOP47_0012029 [Adiantum capillus-veneris]|uniref:Uncharacterized protein n=1 Tax=Adiantum capillus-veneris TaxID=13818 RepID=A0A9D4UTY8_ADICA|nr:hypothetical protein GOP47_0012029 [Adiantum capillus-veneris]